MVIIFIFASQTKAAYESVLSEIASENSRLDAIIYERDLVYRSFIVESMNAYKLANPPIRLPGDDDASGSAAAEEAVPAPTKRRDSLSEVTAAAAVVASSAASNAVSTASAAGGWMKKRFSSKCLH